MSEQLTEDIGSIACRHRNEPQTQLDLLLSECERLKELCEQRQNTINRQNSEIIDLQRQLWIAQNDYRALARTSIAELVK